MPWLLFGAGLLFLFGGLDASPEGWQAIVATCAGGGMVLLAAGLWWWYES